MKISFALAAVVIASSLWIQQTAEAQTVIDIGPRIGIDVGGDVEDFYIGADGRFRTGLPVIINTTFDYYFTESNFSFWQVGGNALYEFSVSSASIVPYAGAGLSISRFGVDIPPIDLGEFGSFGGSASSTDVGLNLIGGASFTAGSLRPFAQAQITVGDVDLFTIGGGLLFTISGG